MLDFNNDEPGKAWPGPFLIKPIGMFLNDTVVTLELEPLAKFGLEVRIRRSLAKPTKIRRKVSVKDSQRVAGVWVRVKALRQENVRSKMHRPSPEIGQQFALKLDVLNVLRVLRWFNWRN